jgi:hypothetical protein
VACAHQLAIDELRAEAEALKRGDPKLFAALFAADAE